MKLLTFTNFLPEKNKTKQQKLICSQIRKKILKCIWSQTWEGLKRKENKQTSKTQLINFPQNT